jgi:hypothetical protein
MTNSIQPNLDAQPIHSVTPQQVRPLSARAEAVDFNPFAEPAPEPSVDGIKEGLLARIDEKGGAARLNQALTDLLSLSTETLLELSPEELNELFETVLRMAKELPETGLGRGIAVLALATFAHHLDFRSGGEAFAAAIEPRIANGFVELALALDASAGEFLEDPLGRTAELPGRSHMPLAKNGEAFEPMLRFLLSQVQGVDRSHRDPAGTRATMRTLFKGLVAGAEQEKADIMAQLQSGDLSEEGLMVLRERLNDANNVVSVLNEILSKENEVLEAIIRNFA